MSSTPSTSAEQYAQSSGSERTPESGTPRTRRAYTKSCYSPSLQAFHSFSDSLAHFKVHILEKIDQIGIDPEELLRTELGKLYYKCETMKEEFQHLISNLDKAIGEYERKKPNELAADANGVISPGKEAAHRSPFSKGEKKIDDIFSDLNTCILTIINVIENKIEKSIYVDQYSASLAKKLKGLKELCEHREGNLEQVGLLIKKAIDRNEEIRRLDMEMHGMEIS